MKKLLLSVIALASMALSSMAQAQNVGIATLTGSLFHSIGTSVANAANKNGLNTTIQPATSPNQFIPSSIQAGLIRRCQSAGSELRDHWRGLVERAEKTKICGLSRICSRLLKLFLFVRIATL